MNLAPETHCQISIGIWDNSNFAQGYPKILLVGVRLLMSDLSRQHKEDIRQVRLRYF